MSSGTPSARRPRMRDVAELAGVGIGTVSNALNRPHLVSEATLARVRAAVETLQFVPDARASALAGGASSTIGFVVTDLANSFFLDMVRGAEQEADQHGMNLLLANADLQVTKQRFYLDLFDRERAAGILVAPSPSQGDNTFALGRWSRPVLVLNRNTGPSRCCVTVDDELGGYRAARHLIDTGRRRLLFAGGPLHLTPLRARHRGVVRAVAESSGAVTVDFAYTDGVRPEHGRDIGALVAATAPHLRPDGIVAAADLLAVGLVDALIERGVVVGPEVGVIGYDDNREAWNSAVRLSTMAQPGEEMGRAAVRLLVEELRDPGSHEHRHVVLEPSLVVRGSSRT